MILRYPTIGDKPFLWVSLLSDGAQVLYPLIFDTGADCACFPANLAPLLGHDNEADGVEQTVSTGVGGQTKAYLHSIAVSLIDPESFNANVRSAPLTVWTSAIPRFLFLEGFQFEFGLLGRDIMREWRRVSFVPLKASWRIDIEPKGR